MISLLTIDTSTPFLSLTCLVAENINAKAWQIYDQQIIEIPVNRDDWLHVAINNLVSQTGVREFSAFAVGKGPGSFTGLRVSFSYVRALCAITERPLATFSSLGYWKKAFQCDSRQAFLTRVNRNLFYGLHPGGSDDDFAAMPLEKWAGQYAHAMVWSETWRDHAKSELDLSVYPNFTLVSHENITTIMPALPSPTEIFSKPDLFHWENHAPHYGHELAFLKNPVQASQL